MCGQHDVYSELLSPKIPLHTPLIRLLDIPVHSVDSEFGCLRNIVNDNIRSSFPRRVFLFLDQHTGKSSRNFKTGTCSSPREDVLHQLWHLSSPGCAHFHRDMEGDPLCYRQQWGSLELSHPQISAHSLHGHPSVHQLCPGTILASFLLTHHGLQGAVTCRETPGHRRVAGLWAAVSAPALD